MRLEAYRAWTLRRLDLLRKILPAGRIETIASVMDLLSDEFGVVGRRILKAAPREARRAPHHIPWIEGLYAIGSVGTVSATIQSDADLWLVVDGRTEEERTTLRRAARHLETWAAEREMEVHVFVHEAREVAAGRFGEDEEGAQAFGPVLAEEFFRSCLWLGGRPPSWWVDDDPSRPRWETPLPLGAPRAGAPDTYFAAALLQLEKAIERPFKSILKLAALRTWALGAGGPLPSETVRDRATADPADPKADPYLALVETVWEASRGTASEGAFALLKTCLYLKGVVEERTPARVEIWRDRLAAAGFNAIGPPVDLSDLDGFFSWPLPRRLELARSILGYLRATLAELSRRAPALPWARETARILARRLEARAAGPGRIERISILEVPSEGDLFTVTREAAHWAVSVGATRPGAAPTAPLRRTNGPAEALAFLAANDLWTPGRTSIRFLPPESGARRPDDLLRRLTRMTSATPHRPDFLAPEMPAETLVVWTREDVRDPSTDRVSRFVRSTWGGLVGATFTGAAAIASALECSLGDATIDLHVDFAGPDEAAYLAAARRASAFAPGEAIVVSDLGRRIVFLQDAVAAAPSPVSVLDALAPSSPPRLLEAPADVRRLVEAVSSVPGPAVFLVDVDGDARAVAVDEEGRWHVWVVDSSDLPHVGRSLYRFIASATSLDFPVFRLARKQERGAVEAVEADRRSWRSGPPEVPVVLEVDGNGRVRSALVANRRCAEDPESLIVVAAGEIRRMRRSKAAYSPRVTEVRLEGEVSLTRLLSVKRRAEWEIAATWRRGDAPSEDDRK